MARPKGEPTMVVRLPAALVDQIDRRRGERTRAEFLNDLLEQPVALPAGPVMDARERAVRGSSSPSLERFR